MNREILFRGKRIDNDEWVYGLLVYMCEILYIVDSEIYNILDNDFENLAHAVKSETIGQYTGLTDKNGKKIFEGDILKIISSVRGEIIGNTLAFASREREDCALVLWDHKTGGYKLKVYHKGKYKRIAKFAIGHLIVYEAEVIGNIYDNPELLEVEND